MLLPLFVAQNTQLRVLGAWCVSTLADRVVGHLLAGLKLCTCPAVSKRSRAALPDADRTLDCNAPRCIANAPLHSVAVF